MKVLFVGKKGLGEFFVEFKHLSDDWLTWQASSTKDMKLIHEKCYFKIAVGWADDLPFIKEDGCTLCGEEAPRNIQALIGLANGLKDYIT